MNGRHDIEIQIYATNKTLTRAEASIKCTHHKCPSAFIEADSQFTVIIAVIAYHAIGATVPVLSHLISGHLRNPTRCRELTPPVSSYPPRKFPFPIERSGFKENKPPRRGGDSPLWKCSLAGCHANIWQPRPELPLISTLFSISPRRFRLGRGTTAASIDLPRTLPRDRKHLVLPPQGNFDASCFQRTLPWMLFVFRSRRAWAPAFLPETYRVNPGDAVDLI